MKTESWFANGIAGRHVLAALFAFFGVMLIANGFLVYYALNTFSGGDRPDPYRSGLQYNETIDASERQAALGWKEELAYDAQKGQVTLRLTDSAEAPVVDLDLQGVLGRPATDREDQELTFKEIAVGTYAADVQLDPGGWVLTVASRTGDDDLVYRLKRRLFVADGS